MLDLDVLAHQIPDDLEETPGALVALNNDYDEWNVTTETVFVGPSNRPVTVYKRLRDNQSDRTPGVERQHGIAASTDLSWHTLSDKGHWTAALDSDLRTAVVTSTHSGPISFEAPENTTLWVPSWALYGDDALDRGNALRDDAFRWIPVREGEGYMVGSATAGLMYSPMLKAIPLILEGMEVGSGEIVASLELDDGSTVIEDTVSVHVVAVDLDVDSDNNNGLELPDRTPEEEQLEDSHGVIGKRIVVNSDDVDQDGIPDLVDGFNLDALSSSLLGEHTEDDQVDTEQSAGFVPVVFDLPDPIDPAKASLQFSYYGSDPAAATVQADGSRQVAPGGLRLWTVDETEPRNPSAANDLDMPGHYVAPQKPGGGNCAYSVEQLTGDEASNQFTLYLEGIHAGSYVIDMEVDPDGASWYVGDASGGNDDESPDLFDGFGLHDSIQVTVESEVVISAVDMIAAESLGEQQVDQGTFLVSRGTPHATQGLSVYYRVVSDRYHSAATDPTIDPSRGDYDVIGRSGATTGLANDPITQVGSAFIPSGASSVAVDIAPRDDRAVEWDEMVSIELISWDEYRELYDEVSVVTPNEGLPTIHGYWSSNRRSLYRLPVDEHGNPCQNEATVTILDNDHVENQSYQQPDQETTGLAAETLGYGSLQVDVHGGHAQYELPVFAPRYREDDNLSPIVESIVRLPEDIVNATSLRAIYTVGGVSGPKVSFDLSGADSYLEPNVNREFRLTVPGPDTLSASLATGHYDHDVQLLVEMDGQTFTRTLRGSTDVVNRVDPLLGTPEWGSGWTLDELDRLFPADGVQTGATGRAVSRLTPLGAATESGMSLVRGDNSISWFRADNPHPTQIVELNTAKNLDADSSSVRFSQPHQWRGYTSPDRHDYRTSAAGLQDEAADVTWKFRRLNPGRMVQIFVQWEPDPALASNAAYHVSADPVAGPSGPIVVDQRHVPGQFEWDGRTWRSLGFFVLPSDQDCLEVRLSTQIEDNTYVDGPLSAGAVMLADHWEFTAPESSASTLQWPSYHQTAEVTTKTGKDYRFDVERGVLRETKDRNGNRTQYHYGDTDRDARQDELVRIVRQGDLETTIDYEDGYVSGITDFAGRETQWHVEEGTVTEVVLPDPGHGMPQPIYNFGYDEDHGLLAEMTDPRGNSSQIERGGNGIQVTGVTNPDGNHWSLHSYLGDGLDGRPRRPPSGSLGPHQEGTEELAEPWAKFVDTRGAVWQYQTDPYSLITAEAQPPLPDSPSHDVWTWKRDDVGLATRIVAPAGGGGDSPLPAIATSQEFDEHGNLLRKTYVDGTFEEWTYDGSYNQVRSYRDRLGRRVSYTLDWRGNVASKTEEENRRADTPDRITRYWHTYKPKNMDDLPGGLVARVVVAAGTPEAVVELTRYHDSGPEIGLPALVRQAAYSRDPNVTSAVQFRYDAHRCLSERIDVSGNSTFFVHDALDRLHQQIDPAPGTGDHGSPTTTYLYDALGNETEIINARGVKTVQQYDEMNRLISETLPPAGGSTESSQSLASESYLYDGEGNLVAQWDAMRHQTSYEYDARNQRTSMIEPAPQLVTSELPVPMDTTAPVTSYSYDAWGNQRAIRDPLGATTHYQYDAFGQRTRVTHPNPGTGQHEAPVSQFTYDAGGQLLESAERGPQGWRVTSYEYDDLGQRRRMLGPQDSNGQRLETEYTYDQRGNPISVTEAGQRTTRFEYDQRNRKTLMLQPDPDGAGPLGFPTTRYEYTVDGSLRSERFFNSADPETALVTRYETDALGRVIHEVTSDPDGAGPRVAPESFYHYDVMGNRISETEVTGPRQTVTRNFFFDRHDRLWKTTQAEGEETSGEMIQVYDLLGNVTGLRERVGGNTATPIYRSTDFTYDALGRRVMHAGPAPSADGTRPTTSFVYDAMDNLCLERDASGTWTQYQVDALGRVVAVIEPGTDDHASPVTTMEYTVSDDLAAIEDPLGRRTEFEYDNLGRMTVERVPAPNSSTGDAIAEVRYGYDVYGNKVSTDDADGNAFHVTHDALDRAVRLTANGRTSKRRYDGLGRIASETDPLGAVTAYGYDLLGRRTVISPPHSEQHHALRIKLDDNQADMIGLWHVGTDGQHGSYQYASASDYDDLQAIWSVSDLRPDATYEVLATWQPGAANVDQALFHLTADGVALIDPVTVDQQRIAGDVVDGNQTWQRIATVTPDGQQLEVTLETPRTSGNLVADGLWIIEVSGNSYNSYDARGNLLSKSDALGNTRGYTYDGDSNLTGIVDENGDTTYIEHDLLGRVQSVTDPLGNVTEYAYDNMDRLVAESVERDGEVATSYFQYDLMGNLLQEVDRLERVRRMQYDALGRLKQESWYESMVDVWSDADRLNVIEYTYDAAGRTTAISDNASSYEYVLDALDRPLVTTIDINAAPPVELEHEYTRQDDLRDALRVSVDGRLDHSTQYTYDDQSRLARVEQSGADVEDKRVEFEYTPADQLSEIRRYVDPANENPAARSEYQFDRQGRLAALTHQQKDNVLAGYEWVFDASNRVVRQDASLDGISRFEYDSRGQLLSAEFDHQMDESHQYDANGNRVDEGSVIGDRNLVESDGRYQYEYDAEGNRTRRVEIATGMVTEYQWGPGNRLVKMLELDGTDGAVSRAVEYTYDAVGRRIGKTITLGEGPGQVERFVYDGDDMVLRFVAGNLQNRYLHGPDVDQVLADEQLGGEGEIDRVLWPLTDHLGTVRDLAQFDPETNATSVVNHLTYDAFGGIVEETEPAIDHIFGFTGREMDAESDLYYYRARYYDPRIGQFISDDPAGFAAGDANPRRYVENDPTNQIDPTGMYGEDVHFYFNYYLARYLGLDQPSGWINSKGQPVSEAYIVSYFATRVDYDRATEPVGGGAAVRQRFHFPDPGGPFQTVSRGDPRVSQALSTVGSTGDLEMFGVLLHVYQDSFSHEGFHKTTGHGFSKDPDRPYLHKKRDRQMAQSAYNKMANLLLARRGLGSRQESPEAKALLQGKSFAKFWYEINAVLLQEPRRVGSLTPFENRIVCWQQLVASDFNQAKPRFNDKRRDTSNPLTRRFREVSKKVPNWYGQSYDHRSLWGKWKPVRDNGPPPWRTLDSGKPSKGN
ncbi:MAG: RHS repeat-associated core domain-containing protein [Planctomycetota bacterium]